MTFTEDVFNRKNVADYILEIIKNKDDIFGAKESLVIGIDSPWGTGKSTFFKMWADELKSQDYEVLEYNAWLDDDYENPLIPIGMKLTETAAGEIKEKIITCILKLGRKMVEKKLNDYDLSDFLEYFKESAATNESGYVEAFKDYSNEKKVLQDLLKEKAGERKVIFLIDELDRCRPIYAIRTLEVIKHYFNIEGMVFVFALDMEQLKHSIATIYGQNMDSYGYLRRFFQYCTKLPKPDIREYLEYIKAPDLFEDSENYVNHISVIFDLLNLTLRDVDVIFSNIKIFLILKLKKMKRPEEKLMFYSYLIALKYKYPENYNTFLHSVYQESAFRNSDETFALQSAQAQDYFAKFQDGYYQKRFRLFDNKDLEFFNTTILIPGYSKKEDERLYSYIERVLEGIMLTSE